jgi:phage terminase small subunit
MITNNKHKNFADDYLLTNNSVLSYQKIYPNASLHSAQTKSGVLLKKVEIKEYIKQKQLEIQNARQNNVIEQLKAKDSSNILTREKIVEMTSNVVKITYNTYVKSKDKADADAFNKSVAVYNKLEGLDASTKIEQTINDKRQGFVEPIIE